MDKTKSLTKSNQPEKSNPKQQKWCRSGSNKHLRITSKDFPVGIAMRKTKKWPWVWDYFRLRQRRQDKKKQWGKR